MENIIQTIDNLTQTLEALKPMKLEYQQRLDKKIRLEFNYNSNHIEGNTLTYGETALLLIFDKTTGNHELREYEEMKAHDVAFEMMREWAADKERPLSEMGIRELHKLLLVRPFWKDALTADGQHTRREIAVGSYKSQPNSVRLQNGEMFHYASPEETPIQMGELVAWYNDEEEKGELHPLVLAALLHYKFVRIHPFDDGNGRISRLLMNYVCFKHNLPPIIIRSADKKNYLFALNQADAGDINAFINYVAEQLVWILELSVRAANGEVLEEEGDLQKEISIWKKGAVSQKVEAEHRDDEIVYRLYNKGGMRKLFESFIQLHQNFEELFHTSSLSVYLNGIPEHLEGLDLKVDRQREKFLENKAKGLPLGDNYEQIVFTFHLKEYKHKENNPFTLTSSLKLNLQPYKYILKYNGNPLLQKEYGEYLSEGERAQIIQTCTQRLFKEIKTLSSAESDEEPPTFLLL